MNKSQNNSAQFEQTTQEEPVSLGAPATSTALSKLFEAAADNLTQNELKYLVGMDEHARLEAENLSKSLMTIGCLIYDVDRLHEPSFSAIGQMFWSLSNQLDHIAGLINLSGDATHRLANPKTKANGKVDE